MELTDDNFLIYAAHHYDNPECHSDDEFYEDLNKFKYIKRLFRRYHKTGTVELHTVRLALNHIILVINVFGPQAGSALLFHKLDSYLYPILKPFLVQLHACPKQVNGINTIDIQMDPVIVKMLRKI